MKILNQIKKIEKECIQFLRFPKQDILSSALEKKNRYVDVL